MEKMIIDFHVHCFPDDLAGKAVPKLAAAAGIDAKINGTVSDLIRSMESAGIFCCVVQPVATRPQQVAKINEWAASQQNDKLIFFASFHPDLAGWRDEIRRIKELGLRGVKFHPDYQNFFVDENRMFPVYEALFEEDLVVLFHAGVDIGLPPPVHCTPVRLARVVDLFLGGKMVAAHMGGYLCWDDVEKYLLGKDIFFDTSYSLVNLEPERMAALILSHGPEKVLFGTDSPWTDQGEELNKIKRIKLPEKVLEQVLGLNAKRILKLN